MERNRTEARMKQKISKIAFVEARPISNCPKTNRRFVVPDFRTGRAYKFPCSRNNRLDRRTQTMIPETTLFQGCGSSPRWFRGLRPGFVRVAKKLDPVTVSSASGIVLIRFLIFLRYLVPFRQRTWHDIDNLSRNMCAPYLKRQFLIVDESWSHVEKKLFLDLLELRSLRNASTFLRRAT